MKHLLSLFIILCILSNSAFKAQDINKMNKSKLKEHVLGLSTQIDSLKDVNYMLEDSKDSLLLNVSLLASANDMNEIEIARLNNVVLKNKQEIVRLQSVYDIQITSLNETISDNQASLVNRQDSISRLQEALFDYQASLVNRQDSISRLQEALFDYQDSSINHQDSISQLQDAILNYQNSFAQLQESVLNYQDSIVQILDSLSNSQTTTNTSNDFLNKYYNEQIPLPNNSFSLVLSKLVFKGTSGYGEKNINATEILDVNEFQYWRIKKNIIGHDAYYLFELQNQLFSATRNHVASKTPIIEVLKNKLFTMKYNDGSEESFLFNVSIKSNNNQRRILRIELANEEVDNGNEDIVWNFCVIEDECYLALTKNQLDRLDYMFMSFNSIQYITTEGTTRIVEDCDREYGCYWNGTTTGEGIYLSRNGYYLDLDNVTFLFKLKEL
jgi:hypothetical protein